MSVNISSGQFLQPSLLDDLKEVLDATGLPPHLLKLEITRTALINKADESIRIAHFFKKKLLLVPRYDVLLIHGSWGWWKTFLKMKKM